MPQPTSINDQNIGAFVNFVDSHLKNLERYWLEGQNAQAKEHKQEIVKSLDGLVSIGNDGSINIDEAKKSIEKGIKNGKLAEFFQESAKSDAGIIMLNSLIQDENLSKFRQELQKEYEEKKLKEEEERKKAALKPAPSGFVHHSHETDFTPATTVAAKFGATLFLLEFFGCSVAAWVLAFAFLYAVRDVGNQQASSSKSKQEPEDNADLLKQLFQQHQAGPSGQPNATQNPSSNAQQSLANASAPSLQDSGSEDSESDIESEKPIAQAKPLDQSGNEDKKSPSPSPRPSGSATSVRQSNINDLD